MIHGLLDIIQRLTATATKPKPPRSAPFFTTDLKVGSRYEFTNGTVYDILSAISDINPVTFKLERYVTIQLRFAKPHPALNTLEGTPFLQHAALVALKVRREIPRFEVPA